MRRSGGEVEIFAMVFRRGRAGSAPFMFHSDTVLLCLFIIWTKCFDGDLAPKFYARDGSRI